MPKFVYAPPKLVSKQARLAPARSKDAPVPSTADAPRPSAPRQRRQPRQRRRDAPKRAAVAPRGEATATRTAPTAVVDTAPLAPARSSEKPRSVPAAAAPADDEAQGHRSRGRNRRFASTTSSSRVRPARRSPTRSSQAFARSSGGTLARDEAPSTLDAPSPARQPPSRHVQHGDGRGDAERADHAADNPRAACRSSRDPSATERPLLTGEPGATASIPRPSPFQAAPRRAEDPAATGESPITHEEMGSGDLVDFDEAHRNRHRDRARPRVDARERQASERRRRDRHRGRPRRGPRRGRGQGAARARRRGRAHRRRRRNPSALP